MPVPSQERRTFLASARKKYQEALPDNPDVVEYLTKTRGLSMDSVNYFRLGVVDDPLPGNEAYKGMLSIPYTAPNGDTLSIRFRNLADIGPKYLTMPGDKPRPFNTPAVERHSVNICLTEGEIDTMILHQLGLPSMGIPGAKVWKKEWGLILRPYRTVFVFTDGDVAGRDFGKMIAEELPNVRIIDMGTYIDQDGIEKSHDVNTKYLVEGADVLLRKVDM